jgi:hypothetical protein
VAPTLGKEREAPGARTKPVVGNAGPLEVSVAGQTVFGQLLRKVNCTAVAPAGVKERLKRPQCRADHPQFINNKIKFSLISWQHDLYFN